MHTTSLIGVVVGSLLITMPAIARPVEVVAGTACEVKKETGTALYASLKAPAKATLSKPTLLGPCVEVPADTRFVLAEQPVVFTSDDEHERIVVHAYLVPSGVETYLILTVSNVGE